MSLLVRTFVVQILIENDLEAKVDVLNFSYEESHIDNSMYSWDSIGDIRTPILFV